MRYQYRYTKDEKRQLAAANRVLDNPTAPPREVNAALRHIQRIQDAAESRAFDGAVSSAEPPADESVDDLVSALEKAEKPTLSNQQLTDTPNAEFTVVAPQTSGKALEVTQEQIDLKTAILAQTDGKTPAVLVPDPEPVCRLCGAIGKWNTRWPIGSPTGKLLCVTCFGELCAVAARGSPEPQPSSDWAADFNVQRNTYSSDYQKSVEIWQEQDRQKADQQDQDRQEHARAEAQLNAARARWIQDGGKL